MSIIHAISTHCTTVQETKQLSARGTLEYHYLYIYSILNEFWHTAADIQVARSVGYCPIIIFMNGERMYHHFFLSFAIISPLRSNAIKNWWCYLYATHLILKVGIHISVQILLKIYIYIYDEVCLVRNLMSIAHAT